ncbi:Serine/threonine-protein kinase smg1 [Terramyces sp. JEL0728]|nr:Serine/threonine-protein kinase smg1 [Terramyces sp. JEL0728]
MKKEKDKKIYIILDQLKKDPSKKRMEQLANHILQSRDNFFLFKFKLEDYIDHLQYETLTMLYILKHTFENTFSFYKWLFETNINRKDSSLLLLLTKLLETETDHFNLILKNIVLLLNQPIDLQYLLEAIILIHSKGKLGNYFQQIIDLLVGWSIESNVLFELGNQNHSQSNKKSTTNTVELQYKTIKNELIQKNADIQKVTIQDTMLELSSLFIEHYSFTSDDLQESKNTKILLIFQVVLKSVYSKYILNEIDLLPVIEIAQTKDMDIMFDFYSVCLLNPGYSFIYDIIYDLHFQLIQSSTVQYLRNIKKILPGPDKIKNLFVDPKFINDYQNYDILELLKIIISNERNVGTVLWNEFLLMQEETKKAKNKTDFYLQIFSVYKNNDALPLFKKLYNLKLNEQTLVHLYQLCNTNQYFTKDHEAIDLQFQIINTFAKPNHYSRNLLGLNWLYGIIQLKKVVGDSLILKLEQSLILYLKSSVVEKDASIKCKIAEMWTLYLGSFGKNRRNLNNTFLVQQLFLQRLNDIDSSTRQAFFSCLCSIDPIDSCLSIPNQNYDEFKRLIISAPSSGTFKSNHFNFVASYIGMASYIQHIDEYYISSTQQDLSEWLPSLFYITQMENILKSFSNSNISNVLQSALITNDSLMYWALWEAARYLVLKRLKCALGGPLQTLEAIENTLDAYIALFDQKSKSDNKQYCDLLKRQSHLLMFIEMLEIQVLNAARGCSNICSTPPKHCILFFNANLKVCQDWFTRIRGKMTKCAIRSENDGSVLGNGFKSLSELFKSPNDKDWNENVYQCFHSLSTTLVSIKDTDGLVGLEKYWKKNVPRNNSVFSSQSALKSLHINPYITQGNLEHAVNECNNFLSTHDELVNCLMSLNDWDSLSTFFQQDQSRLEKYPFESKMLNHWNTDELDSKTTEISQLLMQKGISKTVFELSVCNIKEKDLSVLEQIQDLISTCTLNNTFRTINNVLLVQIMMHFINNQEAGIRIGKAKPKDRISSATINGKNLGQWIELYHLFRKNEKQRDPDLDEIANILTFLSCDTKNLLLANRLINSMQQSLTPSAALKNIFKKARLNFEQHNISQAFVLLLDTVNFQIEQPDMFDLEIKARACHWFALWNQPIRLEMNSKSMKSMELCLGKQLDFKAFPKLEDWIANSFFELSTKIAPKYAKSWYMYGSFCYRFGRKVLDDLIQNLHSEFFSEELHAIQSVIKDQSDEFFEKIMKSFLFNLGEVKEDYQDFKNWKMELNHEEVEQIERMLVQIQAILFGKFESSAESYFEYLKVYQYALIEMNDQHKVSQAEVITSTLRVVRIFVRYGIAMDGLFTTGFKDTPLVPWKNVIPQLFSRLHHPEEFVRKEIANLICRIGGSTPHLIIYPAILGDSDNAETISSDSYAFIINSLNINNETLVNDVKRWIQELQRITVLWEETWQSGLEHLRGEIQARVTKLNRDISRINSNTSLAESEQAQLINQTVSSLLKPLIFAVEKMCESTYLKGAVTPHERKFIDRYAKLIEAALAFLTNCNQSTDFATIWIPFNEILQNMTNDSKNIKNSTLSLKSLSPYLANLSGSAIHMPGLELEEIVMIDSCFNEVKLIPTKTKPKRIQLHSSNGKSYSYLLKGHEDLHLDERIQQFIEITNKLLQSDNSTSSRELHARTYSVIPYGRSYGMIQWIDNASGIFSLYRKWQYWEHTAKLLQKNEEVNIAASHPPRPYDNFMGKIQNAVKNGKLGKTVPRNQWPLEVLKSVFLELCKETPPDILANELWSSSCTPISWWFKAKKFSQTVAVMSIIGYILGLGDRHLDNILIDLEEGSIVHVDFNVCFEKGKRLRVPETVPFRLTQNIITAFGPTGIEGSFRIACQEVLKTLRKNQEILLTLLEAFIYDPLVDWTSNNTSEKQILNLNVNINLLLSRINEQKSSLQDLYLEVPVHINTIHHMGAILESSLNRLEVLKMELCQFNEGIILNASQEKLDQAKLVISETFDEIKAAHFKNKKFLLNYQKEFEKIRKNLQEENVNQFGVPFGNKLGESKRRRAVMYQTVLKSLEWYSKFLDSDSKLFVSQDYYGKQMDVLSAVIEEDFSQTACKLGLNTVGNLLGFKNSARIHHMDNMYKVIFNIEDGLKLLEKVVADLKSNPPVQSADTIGLKLQGNRNVSITCYMLYILEEFGLIAHKFSKGNPIKDQLESFLGEKAAAIVFSSTQSYYATKLIQSEVDPNIVDPIYCSILAGVFSSILDLFKQLAELGFIKQKTLAADYLDQFQVQKIQLGFEKLSFILLREIMPLTIKSIVRGISAVHLLCEKICNLGDEAALVLGSETNSNQYFANAAQLQDCFEEFTHLLSEEDVEAQIIYSKIGNLISMIDDMVGNSSSNSSNLKYKLFLQFVVLIGSFFKEGIDFIANSSLIKTDPTAEFVIVFDESKLFRNHAKFRKSQQAFKDYLNLTLREVFLKPMLHILTRYISSISSEISINVVKTWGNNSTLNENTSVPFVDSSRKILNFYIRNEDITVQGLKDMQKSILANATGKYLELLEYKAISSLESTKELISIKKAALERYQRIHAQSLYVKFDGVEALSYRKEYLKTLESHIVQLQKLNIDLANHDSELQSAASPKHAGTLFTMEKEIISSLTNLCQGVILVENGRLPMENIRTINWKINQNLESAVSCEERLELITQKGLVDGTVEHLEKSIDNLNINETIEFLKNSILKMQHAIESLKKIVEPILKLTDNILNYAKDTAFSDEILNSFIVIPILIKTCKDQWKNVKACTLKMAKLSEDLEDCKDLSLTSGLNTLLHNISSDSAKVISTIFTYSNIEEYSLADANEQKSASETVDESEIQRFNKEQTRNLTAVNVLKLIKAKLDGADNPDHKQNSVEEHVDYLIRSATDVNNLAKMYEGWMSWI